MPDNVQNERVVREDTQEHGCKSSIEPSPPSLYLGAQGWMVGCLIGVCSALMIACLVLAPTMSLISEVCLKCKRAIHHVPYKFGGETFHARCLQCSTCGESLV